MIILTILKIQYNFGRNVQPKPAGGTHSLFCTSGERGAEVYSEISFHGEDSLLHENIAK